MPNYYITYLIDNAIKQNYCFTLFQNVEKGWCNNSNNYITYLKDDAITQIASLFFKMLKNGDAIIPNYYITCFSCKFFWRAVKNELKIIEKYATRFQLVPIGIS